MNRQIVIPSEYNSFLFNQKTTKQFISAAYLIAEKPESLKDLSESSDWMPPFKPLCAICHVNKADNEHCFLCDMIIQKEKELFTDERVPDAVIWIYAKEGFIPIQNSTVLSFSKNHFCMFCKRTDVYDYLFNSLFNVNLVVIELNRSIKHIGNVLLMSQHHAVHISKKIAVKFIFADAQIYSSEFIYDQSFVFSQEDLKHIQRYLFALNLLICNNGF